MSNPHLLREPVVLMETGIRKSLNLDTLTLGEPVIVTRIEGTQTDAAEVRAAGRNSAPSPSIPRGVIVGRWRSSFSTPQGRHAFTGSAPGRVFQGVR